MNRLVAIHIYCIMFREIDEKNAQRKDTDRKSHSNVFHKKIPPWIGVTVKRKIDELISVMTFSKNKFQLFQAAFERLSLSIRRCKQ